MTIDNTNPLFLVNSSTAEDNELERFCGGREIDIHLNCNPPFQVEGQFSLK